MKLYAAVLKASADDACALLKALASSRRDGQSIYYGLQGGHARAQVETLSRLFCTVLDRAPS